MTVSNFCCKMKYNNFFESLVVGIHIVIWILRYSPEEMRISRIIASTPKITSLI